jgi:hypothetical protein
MSAALFKAIYSIFNCQGMRSPALAVSKGAALAAQRQHEGCPHDADVVSVCVQLRSKPRLKGPAALQLDTLSEGAAFATGGCTDLIR